MIYMVPETRHFERLYNEQGIEVARLTELPDGLAELAGVRLAALFPDEVRRVRDMLTRYLDGIGDQP